MPPKNLEVTIKKQRKPTDYPFHLEYQTRWFDNDMYAHLNNTVYPALFDSIVNAYLIRYCGMDPFNRGTTNTNDDNKSNNKGISQVAIMVNSYCDYFASVSYPDILDLGMRVSKIGSSSVTYEIGVFKKGYEGEGVKVVGGFTHVWVDKGTMRPVKGGMESGIRGSLERLVVGGNTGSTDGLKSKL